MKASSAGKGTQNDLFTFSFLSKNAHRKHLKVATAVHSSVRQSGAKGKGARIPDSPYRTTLDVLFAGARTDNFARRPFERGPRLIAELVFSHHKSADMRSVMSSFFKDDADSEITRAAPWVSHPHHQEQMWRFQEQVVEDAQPLQCKFSKLSSQNPAQADCQNSENFQWAASLPVKYGEPEEISRRIWTALNPEFMPPPPRESVGLQVLATAAGVIAAMAAGAIITLVGLVVANVIQIPTISAGVSGDQFSSASNFRNLAKVSWAMAKMQPADDPPDTPDQAVTALATASPNESAAPSRPSPKPAPPSTVDVARPKTAAPIAITTSQPGPTILLTRDEAASLFKRGRDLIAAGDIVGARMIFKHLADAGDVQATFMLASTFDAAVIATLKVIGVQPDPAKARAWYARAAELGSSEARQRLQQSPQH
jgi:hypothetical protein